MSLVFTSQRRRLVVLAGILVPLGIATKLYAGPGSTWIGGHLGGSVYVTFWCVLVLAIWPHLSAVRVAVAVLVCTTGIEFLQLWHPPILEAARGTLLGQALLGSSYSWVDIPYYALGAAAAVALARWAGRREPR